MEPGISRSIALLLATLILQGTAAQTFVRIEDEAGLEHITSSNGVAVADYDRDGDLDIFLVGFLSFEPANEATWNRLLRNNGNSTFEDVTLAAGFTNQFVNTGIAAARGEKMGAAWGDYDSDGYPDLFLTNSREDQLYHNEGDGTFVDVTAAAGVVGCRECYSSSGLWWDYDGDGDLDLYVSIINGFNIMYENRGDGSFRNVTEKLGVAGAGITWTSVTFDVNNDGLLDLYNVNDTQKNQLFVNKPGRSFEESAGIYGLDDIGAGMGVTIGDHNNDGLFDIYVTNIFNHLPNPLFTRLAEGNYRNDARRLGVENTGWGWGTHFFDSDHDGDEDLYSVNGVEENQYLFNELQTDVNNFFYKNLLMEGTQGFIDWSVQSGTDGMARGRGLEVFDFDEDGDLDLLVGNNKEKPYFFRNETISGNQPETANWIKIWLEGTLSNRNAFGTAVKATANGNSYYRWHHGAGFLSQSIKPVHFGLASAEIIDEIQISWPSGLTETISNVAVNQTLHIKEGDHSPVTGLDKTTEGLPEAGSYPNPFNHSTTFHFSIPKAGSLELSVMTNFGQEVFREKRACAEDEVLEISWNGEDMGGNNLPAGVYYYIADDGHRQYKGKILKWDKP